MASGRYVAANEAFLGGDLDLLNDDIRAIIVDTADYTVDLASHTALDDVPSGARVAVAALTGKSISGGVFDADDTTFEDVEGDSVEAIVLYKHTGIESTSTLIAYIDGVSATPNGGDIDIVWDNGANKIFKL